METRKVSRLTEIESRLSRWQDELPKLIQPEREHVQNIDDLAYLINRVRRLEAALELVRDNAFSDMEGAGEPEFSNYDQTVGICGKALGEEE